VEERVIGNHSLVGSQPSVLADEIELEHNLRPAGRLANGPRARSIPLPRSLQYADREGRPYSTNYAAFTTTTEIALKKSSAPANNTSVGTGTHHSRRDSDILRA
jgi:hypothetical protein